jgi:ABC-2 type transport system permease protein
MPLLFVVAVLVPVATHLQQETRDLRCVVVDRTGGGIAAALRLAAAQHNRLTERDGPGARGRVVVEPHVGAYDDAAAIELSARVRAGEISAFVELRADVLSPEADLLSVRYVSAVAGGGRLAPWLRLHLARAVHRERLARAGLDADAVERARPPLELVPLAPYRRDSRGQARTGRERDPIEDLTVPAVAALLMFMAVMLGAAPLMQSVLEEKTQRIAEILVSSVAPFHLMLGKLLGASAVSFLLLVLYFGGAYGVAVLAEHAGWFTWQNVAWLMAFQSVALLMYGSIFLTIGSLCNDLRESQTLMVPAMLLCTMPLLMLPLVVTEPGGGLAVALSFVPFFTPVLMMLRVTLEPGAPAWQAALGLLMSSGTALGCVALAGRFLRVGLLSRGPAPRLREVVRWLRQS